MTTKKTTSVSRTKSGTLKKTAVAKAVKGVSSSRSSRKSSKKTTFKVGRDASSGEFLPSTNTSPTKSRTSSTSSKIRTKSGSLKRTVIKDAIGSVSKSRSSQKKKK